MIALKEILPVFLVLCFLSNTFSQALNGRLSMWICTQLICVGGELNSWGPLHQHLITSPVEQILVSGEKNVRECSNVCKS